LGGDTSKIIKNKEFIVFFSAADKTPPHDLNFFKYEVGGILSS